MPGAEPDRSFRYEPRHKPFRPAIGRDFGDVEEIEARTRGFLVRFLASTSGACVAATGAYGLATQDYRAVMAVWAVAGPIIGAMAAYYFGPRRNDLG